jgi:hypothetical protein
MNPHLSYYLATARAADLRRLAQRDALARAARRAAAPGRASRTQAPGRRAPRAHLPDSPQHLTSLPHRRLADPTPATHQLSHPSATSEVIMNRIRIIRRLACLLADSPPPCSPPRRPRPRLRSPTARRPSTP